MLGKMSKVNRIKKSESVSLKWHEEGCSLVDPTKYVFQRCFEEKTPKPELGVFPDGHCTSKLCVFRQMWPLLHHIPS